MWSYKEKGSERKNNASKVGAKKQYNSLRADRIASV